MIVLPPGTDQSLFLLGKRASVKAAVFVLDGRAVGMRNAKSHLNISDEDK
jgi:hypothetical protein